MVNSPTCGWLRLARAAVVTITALGLGVGAHRIGGGVFPSPSHGVFLALATFTVCWACTSRCLGRAAIAVLLGLLQLSLHLGLMAMGPPMVGSSAMPMPAGSGGSGLAHFGVSWWMLLAHVTATALTAIVLARGEQAVWFIARQVRRFLPSPDGRALCPAGAQRPPAVQVLGIRHSVHALGGIGRRGPPLATA